MAWDSSQPATGAALLSAPIRENFQALDALVAAGPTPPNAISNPMTAVGDLIRGGTAGLPTRLAVGANGDRLTLVAGVPAWVAPPADVGFANPMTTPGDLIRGDTAGVATRLGIGANGDRLTLVAGLPAWVTPTAGAPAYPLLAPDGTVAAPSYSFASQPASGLFWVGSNIIGVTLGGAERIRLGSGVNGGLLAIWANTATFLAAGPTVAAPDLQIARDGADIWAQRRSAAPQTFRLYNTFTDAANGEWLESLFSANNAYLRTNANGAGTVRELRIAHGGTTTMALRILPTLDAGIGLAGFNVAATALGQGRVTVGQSSSATAASGGHITFRIMEWYSPTVTSTMIVRPLEIISTVNYSAATPGSGFYEAIKIAITETALPTGQSYMIRAMGGAAGSTDVFAVTRDGLTRLPPGTAALPALAPLASPTDGIRFDATLRGVVLVRAGADMLAVGSTAGGTNGVGLRSAVPFGWVSATDFATIDVALLRDAANTLALRNGTAVQTFRVYNTYTDGANYERVEIAATAAATYIQQVAVGSGVARPLWLNNNGAANLVFGVNSVARWSIIATVGHFQPNVDGAHDLGGGAARVRSLYLSEMLSMSVQTAPATPAANRGSLYMKADKKLYFKDDAGVETALW